MKALQRFQLINYMAVVKQPMAVVEEMHIMLVVEVEEMPVKVVMVALSITIHRSLQQ